MTIDSSEYSRRKTSIELIKNARTKTSNFSIGKQYIINFTTNNIDWFISYEIFKRFVDGFYITEPSCNFVGYAPLIIDNALTSEINYNDMFEYIQDEFYESHCDKYDKLIKVSICKEKTNILYAYGTYFRNKEQKLYNFPIKINLDNCEDKDLCYKMIHCEDCEKKNHEYKDYSTDYKYCSSCESNTYKETTYKEPQCCINKNPKEHQHMFPSQYRFRYYTHNHDNHPHNTDGKYLFTNYRHTLPFSIFPRLNKDSKCLFIKPNGTHDYKINKGKHK